MIILCISLSGFVCVFLLSFQVYTAKFATDMNLFYSMGDSQVFLTLQVYCRNAEAVGGSIGGVLAVWLFTMDPAAPFAFSAGLSCNLEDKYISCNMLQRTAKTQLQREVWHQNSQCHADARLRFHLHSVHCGVSWQRCTYSLSVNLSHDVAAILWQVLRTPGIWREHWGCRREA